MARQNSMFVTSDLITYNVVYLDCMAAALKRECGLTLTQYRMLSYLSDHPEGIRPTPLARILDVSPALISIEIRRLISKNLIRRVKTGVSDTTVIRLSKDGLNKARDADLVLAAAHNDFFAPLSSDMRIVIESGSMITNIKSELGNRIRDGHFFSSFETLHAFLIVESSLNNLTQSNGLSLTEFRVLFELSTQDDESSPSLLADTLLLSRPLMTHALKRLIDKGFVSMRTAQMDRRSKTVALTDTGLARLASVIGQAESLYTGGIRASQLGERSVYKDAASLIVSHRRKLRHVSSR